MAKVAFIGLGVMGFPMAGHLAKAGHDVTVYNRTPPRPQLPGSPSTAARPRRHAGGRRAGRRVRVCLRRQRRRPARRDASAPTAPSPAWRAGAIFVDHTTASAEARARADAAAAAARHRILDAPVSGGQAGAENGTLTVMCGGDADAFERAEPVIAHYARAVTLMGPAGRGPAHQDGQPDLHRRVSCRALPRASTSPSRPGLDIEARARRHLQGRGAVLADGEPRQDHGATASSISASPSTGCARTSRICLDEAAAQRRRAAGHGAGRSVLRRRAADRRRALGHLQPDPASQKKSRRGESVRKNFHLDYPFP